MPQNKELKKRYNYRETVLGVFNLIQEFSLQDYCFVSSFNYKALQEMERVSATNLSKVRTIYLYNYWSYEGLPPLE